MNNVAMINGPVPLLTKTHEGIAQDMRTTIYSNTDGVVGTPGIDYVEIIAPRE
jgi:hypothetical protein